MSVLIKGLSTEKVKHCFEFAKSGWCIFNIPEIIEIPDEPQTNADHIRSMTNNELADWITGIHLLTKEVGDFGEVSDKWLNWLKEEITDKDGE